MANGLARRHGTLRQRFFQTMIEVLVNELALGIRYGVFNGMELMRHLKAIPTALQHADERAHVPLCSPEALHNCPMACFAHDNNLSWGIGCCKRVSFSYSCCAFVAIVPSQRLVYDCIANLSNLGRK